MNKLLQSSLVLIAVAAFTGALFLSRSGPAAAADTTVPVGNFFFCGSQFQDSTCTTTISIGDTVTWDFGGATVTHTTSSSSGEWDSGNVSPGGTFQHTFTQAGSFPYHCNVHPMLMMGTIVVQAAAPTPTSRPSGGATPTAVSTRPAATPIATTTGALPSTGQGPQRSDSDWWLLAGLVFAGVAFAGTGFALTRRAR